MKTDHYQAAGGIVVADGKMLLLERPGRGEIRLPKGHVELGESLQDTALRETREEAGYADLEIVADLGMHTSHFFNPRTASMTTRDEFYFLMRLRTPALFARDEHDANQFKVLWVPVDQAADRLTFESEKEFARRAARAVRGAQP